MNPETVKKTNNNVGWSVQNREASNQSEWVTSHKNERLTRLRLEGHIEKSSELHTVREHTTLIEGWSLLIIQAMEEIATKTKL